MGNRSEEQDAGELTPPGHDPVSLEGAALHYERKGSEGIPMVLLHGFGGDLRVWDHLWEALPPSRAAVRYDLRGFGRSAVDRERPFDHADDLLVLLDRLGIDRCDLVGLSMGGAIALDFALDRPGRVRRLALVSPGMIAWDWTDEWRQLWRAIAARARAGAMDEARALWWAHPLFATTRGGPAAETLRRSIDRYAGAQWIKEPHVHKLPDIERVHALAVPTLLLAGGKDMADFRLIADVLASVDNVERVDFPEHGHMLPLEAPEEIAGRIFGFLDRAK